MPHYAEVSAVLARNPKLHTLYVLNCPRTNELISTLGPNMNLCNCPPKQLKVLRSRCNLNFDGISRILRTCYQLRVLHLGRVEAFVLTTGGNSNGIYRSTAITHALELFAANNAWPANVHIPA